MNILSFTYTKSPTDITERVYIPLAVPNKNYFGIDITELEPVDQVALVEEIEALDVERKCQLDEIMTRYDIKTNYRSFCPEKMSNIVKEE
jgi:hypothetical protein